MLPAVLFSVIQFPTSEFKPARAEKDAECSPVGEGGLTGFSLVPLARDDGRPLDPICQHPTHSAHTARSLTFPGRSWEKDGCLLYSYIPQRAYSDTYANSSCFRHWLLLPDRIPRLRRHPRATRSIPTRAITLCVACLLRFLTTMKTTC